MKGNQFLKNLAQNAFNGQKNSLLYIPVISMIVLKIILYLGSITSDKNQGIKEFLAVLKTASLLSHLFGFGLPPKSLKKSRIRETKHRSTDADSSTDTTVGWTKNSQKPIFLKNGKNHPKRKNSKTSRDMPILAIYPSTRGL